MNIYKGRMSSFLWQISVHSQCLKLADFNMLLNIIIICIASHCVMQAGNMSLFVAAQRPACHSVGRHARSRHCSPYPAMFLEQHHSMNTVRTQIRNVSQRATTFKMHLIFDFDGTITKKDTIATLAEAGIAAQRSRNGSNLKSTWDEVVQAYMADYNAYKANYKPAEQERTSLQQEAAYLAGLKSAEEASLDRVGKSGIFAGLRTGDFVQFGEEAARDGAVELRDGFGKIMQLAREKGWRVSVLSVNWSRHFISGVLGQYDVNVVANRIDEGGIIRGPDELGDGRLTSSADKLRVLKQISHGDEDEKVVYFGDSTTDLECLLYDRGVIIASDAETSLMKTLQRINMPAVHASKRTHERLQWATTLDEVVEVGVLEE